MPKIWYPPRRLRDDSNGYFAVFGKYWELPCSHARVRAAQLQHRVPCWGYVIEELLPSGSAQVTGQDRSFKSSDVPKYKNLNVGRKVSTRCCEI